MADGRAPTPPTGERPGSWREIFRCAQVALDPRKLFVAAVGILVMSFFWWLLSYTFYTEAPKPSDNEYTTEVVGKSVGRVNPETGKEYTNEERERAVAAEARRRYEADYAQWKVLDGLAGPGGRLRTMPWYEYRGPNPFLFVTDVISGSAAERRSAVEGFVSGSVPVLVEPLVKLLIPVAKLISPDVNLRTRIYLFLILLVNVAVWAFAGGIITRMAAVHLANKGPISLGQAYRFVRNRYLAYIGSPLVPLIIVFACVVGLALYGVLGLIPFVGDLFVLGLGLPVVIIGGAVMAIFLVGLVGYPLMYPTLSAEGDQSDTFDALSRSINYVYQSPWAYIWYWVVAILYGAAVALFVLFFGSLTVYVGKWAVGLTANMVWTDRKPEYLFIYAPESFGWKELLTKDSPYAVRGSWVLVKDGREYGHPNDAARAVMLDKTGKETTNPAEAVRTVTYDRDDREVLPNPAEADRQVYRYTPVDPAANKRAREEFYQYNYWGAGIVAFWLALLFLMLLGFSYSFFWTAATMIYFLMRKRVDEAELDEVYTEDEEPEPPLAPPKIGDGTGAPPTAGSPTSLPVIAPPSAIPPAPPPMPVSPPPLPPVPTVTAPPPPPATLPFTPPSPPPPVATSPPATYTTPEPPPRASDERKPREEPKKEEPRRDEPKRDEPKKADADDDVPLG